ncbi:MAG: Threonylcarbamoyladenosine tRNA methylthiotransferase MtaB [Calditrichaeota bacterium]|nr:Threonylcarbamoyladenosine tRNA methylthiotransferase MtaB [Calditrichota bacterium]
MSAARDIAPSEKQPTVAFATVGCRLNQAETDAVQDRFLAAGYRVVAFADDPDVVYLNTCTVTGRADRSSRQWIHRARRRRADSVIIVAGCFANRVADELARGGEVDVILGQREKLNPLAHLPHGPRRPAEPVVANAGPGGSTPAAVGTRVTGRSRAFLKVQDGCDRACTYCAVTLARGPSASAPAREVREALRRIADAGYEEVVFTGVDLADWRNDQRAVANGEPDFVSLVELASDAGLPRVRLSSLEPWALAPDLIRRLAQCEPWCEHVHIALQSGDPGVLRRMNRLHDLGRVREAMQELIRLRPEATIGADMIAGFPGETEQAFANTQALVAENWVHYLHVFPFSPRPGTTAARIKSRVDPDTVRKRARRLRELSHLKKLAHMRAAVAKKAELLAEQNKRTGYTRNYLRADLRADASRGPGKLVPVRITGVDHTRFTLEAEEMR